MKRTTSVFSFVKAAAAAALAIAVCGSLSVPAVAQSNSPAAAQSNLPSYATGDESVRGRIASVDGKYYLQVRDDRGFIDNISLHDGTIINPTGLRLAPGQSVTIHGHNTGKTFEASEIDTAYAMYGVPGYGPYPYYGYPYGPYPAFGLGFRSGGFGFRGWF